MIWVVPAKGMWTWLYDEKRVISASRPPRIRVIQPWISKSQTLPTPHQFGDYAGEESPEEDRGFELDKCSRDVVIGGEEGDEGDHEAADGHSSYGKNDQSDSSLWVPRRTKRSTESPSN